jgi:hypothetical protein
MRKQLSKAKHETINKRQQQIDSGRAKYGKDCWWLVEDYVLACVGELPCSIALGGSGRGRRVVGGNGDAIGSDFGGFVNEGYGSGVGRSVPFFGSEMSGSGGVDDGGFRDGLGDGLKVGDLIGKVGGVGDEDSGGFH